MKNIDTILFDFDGTIMDTNDMIIKSWQYTFEQLRGEKGGEKRPSGHVRRTAENDDASFFRRRCG